MTKEAFTEIPSWNGFSFFRLKIHVSGCDENMEIEGFTKLQDLLLRDGDEIIFEVNLWHRGNKDQCDGLYIINIMGDTNELFCFHTPNCQGAFDCYRQSVSLANDYLNCKLNEKKLEAKEKE